VRRHLVALTVLTLGALGCGRPPSLVWEGGGPARQVGLPLATAGLAAATPGTRRGPWGEASDETLLLMESDQAEEPHVHARHDLTVVLLRGRGTLVVEGRRYDLRGGDIAHIARGKVHAFAPAGHATALAIFTPRLEGPDSVPASAMGNAAANAR